MRETLLMRMCIHLFYVHPSSVLVHVPHKPRRLGKGRRTIALSQIINHRALMRVPRPGIPIYGERITCIGIDVKLSGRSGFMAGDVARLEAIGRDEAVVLVQRIPPGRWRCALRVVVPRGIRTWEPSALVDADARYVAVG